MMKEKMQQFMRLLTIALMLVVVAIERDGRVLGHDLAQEQQEQAPQEQVTRQADGTLVISTRELGKGITGYGGPTPLTVTVKDGIVASVVAEKNNESPRVF